MNLREPEPDPEVDVEVEEVPLRRVRKGLSAAMSRIVADSTMITLAFWLL